MSVVFSNDEKDKIRDTLSKVIVDLRSIYDISQEDVINYDFSTMENGKKYDYGLVIKAKESFIYLRYCDWYMQLDKKIGKTYRPGKIKDYTTAYEFLKQYDKIRRDLLMSAKNNQHQKDIGMSKIDELNNKYAKEAIIEVEMPETINPHAITLKQEAGKSVGEIRMNAGTIRIITSGSIVIDKQEFDRPKVKKR